MCARRGPRDPRVDSQKSYLQRPMTPIRSCSIPLVCGVGAPPCAPDSVTCSDMLRKVLRRVWIPSQHEDILHAQNALLTRFVERTLHQTSVDVGGGLFLNVVDTASDEERLERSGPRRTLVLAHGLGSGLGFFFNNFDALAREFDRVVAFDWMGMGASSRPQCQEAPKLRRTSKRVSRLTWCESNLRTIEENIDFFVEPTHTLLASSTLNIKSHPEDRVVLCGHSLGGYLSACYAAKYPKDVETLVLLSPAGISNPPREDLTIPSSELPRAMRLVDVAWSQNITPGQLIRAFGRRGPRVVHDVVRRRFGSSRWDDEDARLISSYLYHITAAPGSGEYAMNSLLRPIVSRETGAGIFARKPLTEILGDSSVDNLSRIFPQTTIIFGDNDWLYQKSLTDSAVDSMKASGFDVRLYKPLLPRAGHHLYLDNPDGVCEILASHSIPSRPRGV